MSLLLTRPRLDARRAAARGPLRALADSLSADLAPFLGAEPFVPKEKARLSRAGGRCPDDGTTLDFDPRSPREHRCPRCGRVYTDEVHYRSWLLWYQLWLAERAVHAAALHLLRGDPGCAPFADAVLARYADRYLQYANRDNVLGPTRPFFSTYLESIWLLQLAVALDLREQAGDCAASLSASVRERIVAPSAQLIASYDEGTSNRQVWNDAALLAAARLLGDSELAERALHGPSGVVALLDRALLADGTWYEGDNYHQFAHRGLWYGVTLAEAAGCDLPRALLSRFEAGFAAPFVTALPDFTFPSRRDSQYAVSLRQWRFAEMAELGLARASRGPIRETLVGALYSLYDDVGDTPRRDTGRATSAAEAERNVPPSALTRADLGWRSLLFACETLPSLRPVAPRSLLLEAQGFAVFRRDRGRVYAALDYGRSGGGHGHPDRLNLLLVDGATRWLDDVGTGSYVDRSLHWYRSTLAHNAPLVDGRSQTRSDGVLLAYDERGGAGWVDASAEIAAGVTARRAVLVMPDYLVDQLEWRADRDVRLDLPLHVDGETVGAGYWRPTRIVGAGGVEDGFDFLSDVETLGEQRGVSLLRAECGASVAELRSLAEPAAYWWRATAPGPPSSPAPRRFHVARQQGRGGRITGVWSWRGAVRAVRSDEDRVVVELADGSCHVHARSAGGGWHVGLLAGGASSSIDLAGAVSVTPPDPTARERVATTEPSPRTVPRLAALPPLGDRAPTGALVTSLGEAHYRRSEQSWREAGAPTADVALYAVADDLVVELRVRESSLLFAPRGAENEMDNEHPDVNGDGVQLYVGTGAGPEISSWRVVPEWPAPTTRVAPIAGLNRGEGAAPLAEWRAVGAGYLVRCVVPLGAAAGAALRLDVVVNETAPGRERRRGQLVLSGGAGEWVYLRGDRQPVDRLVPFRIAPVATLLSSR